MSIDTLLFDLDGTLVDQVQAGSSLQFSWLVVRRFAGLAPPLLIVRAGLEAVKALQNHRSDATNFDVMISAFARVARCEEAAARARLAGLAQTDFVRMGWRFRPTPGARAVVEWARDRGFRLVLATNPTVPLAMTRHRLAWAGLAHIDWLLITHPEIMTRTKPDPDYYRELLTKLAVRPEHCLMVGNDPRKDLPALDVGIRTFLLDAPRSRAERARIALAPPHDHGDFADLEALLASLRL